MLVQNLTITKQSQLPKNCSGVEFANVFFNIDFVSDMNFSDATLRSNCTFKEGFYFNKCNLHGMVCELEAYPQCVACTSPTGGEALTFEQVCTSLGLTLEEV